MARRGGDKLYNKAKEKKDFKRKNTDKDTIKSIIIACEDSVSSPIYFQKIIDKLIYDKKITPNSVVIVPHDGYTNPSGVLNNLKKYKKDIITWRNFEYKWVVIDRDTEYKGGGHTAEDFNNALKNAKNRRKNLHIDVAYANDSFELWYLLHFDYRVTPIMRDEIIVKVIERLKYIEPHKYAKLTKDNIKNRNYSEYIFNTLISHQQTAIDNSKKLLTSYRYSHNPEQDNPSTTIHELVEVLNILDNN